MNVTARAVTTVAAAAIFAGATMAPALAKVRVIKQSKIYVESDFSNKSARVPIRLVSRNGGHPYWQYTEGDGHWQRCFEGCYEAYRKEVLGFLGRVCRRQRRHSLSELKHT